MLGTTTGRLFKGKDDCVGKVYSVRLGSTEWYSRQSIERYKDTGDGLFPLPRMEKTVDSLYDGEEPWFDEYGYLIRPISDEDAQIACHSGRCDEDVEVLMEATGFHVEEELGRKYLKSLGYDRDEVDAMGPRELDMNVLWCICGDINEMDDITGSQERWRFVNIKEA